MPFLLGQHAGHAGSEEAGDAAAEQSAPTQPGEIFALTRRECADTADLDADGNDIGKTAQRVGEHENGTWIVKDSSVFEFCHRAVGNELVEHGFLTKELSGEKLLGRLLTVRSFSIP